MRTFRNLAGQDITEDQVFSVKNLPDMIPGFGVNHAENSGLPENFQTFCSLAAKPVHGFTVLHNGKEQAVIVAARRTPVQRLLQFRQNLRRYIFVPEKTDASALAEKIPHFSPPGKRSGRDTVRILPAVTAHRA